MFSALNFALFQPDCVHFITPEKAIDFPDG